MGRTDFAKRFILAELFKFKIYKNIFRSVSHNGEEIFFFIAYYKI